MKRTLLACALSLTIANLYAAAPATAATIVTSSSTPDTTKTTTVPTPTAATVASTTYSTAVPLNKYGAVNVNAKVPYEAQVPPAPADFQAPALNPLVLQWPGVIPTQPDLNVEAYLLMDANSGNILAEYNGNKRLPPASITKLMLVYIAEQQLASGTLHLTDKVNVPQVAWATGGSRMFLKPGSLVTIDQLINGILVDSGNDAAVTLATDIAGSQSSMTDMMNSQAQKLGMTNSHFSTVMGLPAPNLYSSARDLAVLARTMILQFPQNQPWFARKSYTYDNIKQYNFNKLLFIYSYADGMKTGSTAEAGFSLVSTAKMPNDPMRLIAVVLGAPTNNENASASKSLLTYGFRFFQSQMLYPAGKVLTQAPISGGATKTVDVGITQDLYATYPRTSKGKLSADLQLNQNITAPITKGQVLGQVVISLDGKPFSTAPAVAMKDVAKGTWWQQLMNWF